MVNMNAMTEWILIGFGAGVALTVLIANYRHSFSEYMRAREMRKQGIEVQS